MLSCPINCLQPMLTALFEQFSTQEICDIFTIINYCLGIAYVFLNNCANPFALVSKRKVAMHFFKIKYTFFQEPGNFG